MILRLTFIFMFLVFVFFPSLGQIVQPGRLEIEIKGTENRHTVIAAEEHGLVVFRNTEERGEKGNEIWEFISVDTLLTPRWKKNFDIAYKLQILGYDHSHGKTHLLFRDGYSFKDDYLIITMDVMTGDTVHSHVRKLVPMQQLTHFEIVGKAALMGGLINYRPTIVHYDFELEKSKVIPGIYKGEREILELKVDDKTRTFNVLITEKTLDRLLTVTLMSFDETGQLLQNTKLEPDKNKSLIFAGSTAFKDEAMIVSGTYSHKRSSYSRGIFIAKIDELGNHNIAYYSYADLENFFSYMTAKREARIKKRIERKKVKGKKAKFTYRMLVRDVVEKDGSYIMVGEAFYPRYGSNSFYGGMTFSTFGGSHFLGYRFTHAIVVGFDSSGKVLWDNSFEINDVEQFNLDPVINVSIEDEKVALLYLYDGEIRSKIIEDNEVIEGEPNQEIQLRNETDEVKNTTNEYGGMDLWYDKYFYAFGIQKLKNKNLNLPDREVFFINKVTYK